MILSFKSSRAVRLAIACMALASASCAANLHEAPPPVDAAFQPATVEGPPGLEPSAAAPFVLLPGDIIRFRTLSVEPLEEPRVPVDEAGRVELPLVGSVPVQGLTLTAAGRRIEEKIHAFDRHARVALAITDAAGHRATVLGAVDRAGSFPLTPGARLTDLMALAGGPKMGSMDAETTDLADVEAARLVRDGQVLPISVALALTGAPRHNVVVSPGDVVYVPPMRAAAVSVLGEVKNARTVAFRAGLRLTEAIARAGGATSAADNGDVRIVRGPLSRPHVYTTSLAALVDGKGTDVVLARGDVVYVTKHWTATVGDVMQRLTPVLAAAALGATLNR
ncbi:MAG TPA: polysaccharide biosynthesis/export family protein [Polyangia bacterium]|nr:polysaccharide biosynthesis/export family protein [Polyangia bacterium]